MSNIKKYVITSITLGIIAAGSAGLVALANLATRDRIKQNEIESITKGMDEIFGKSGLKYDEKALKGDELANYKYVKTLYTVKEKDNNALVGYALKTSGSNMYGKITLIVGVDKDTLVFKRMSVITNEQTYASTLVDNYIDPLNGGTIGIDDVSCGATYGAKLVREMINEATTAAGEVNWTWGD